MNLRALHPRREVPLFHVAWRWRESYPRLVRRWDMVTDFEQWLGMMQRRVSIGVFDPCLIALVTLEPIGDDVYEVHVDCERHVSQRALTIALLSLRRTVFEQWGAREVFAGVVSRNCGIIRLARECGFMPDGIEEHAGPLKFIRLRMTRDEFDQNKHEYFDGPAIGSVQPAEPVHPHAGRVVA